MESEKKFKYEYFPNGAIIFEEGSLGTDIYFIVSGEAEVSQLVSNENHVIAKLHKGDFFGEMAPLTNTLRSMTVKSTGDLYVYRLTLEEMLNYIMGSHEVLRTVCNSFAKRLQETDLKVKELSIMVSLQNDRDLPQLVKRITYLQSKLQEKDKQIEDMKKQIAVLTKK